MLRRLLRTWLPFKGTRRYKIVIKVDDKVPITRRLRLRSDGEAVDVANVAIQHRISIDTRSITAKVWCGRRVVFQIKGEVYENQELDLDARHSAVCEQD